MIPRSLLLIPATLLLASCSSGDPLDTDVTSSARQEIVGGVQDTGTENNAVVMIYSAYGSMCTGSLIAPKVVLTAWHCVAQTKEYVTCSDNDIGSDYKASNLYILKGVDPFDSAKAVAKGTKIFHPAKAGKGLCGRDIALIALSNEVSGVTPLPVRLEAAYAKGEKFRAIGYGLTDQNDENSSGVRYYRDDVQMTSVLSNEFIGTRSICSGDSGGPAISQKGAVIGVTSRGADCNGDDNLWTRVDKFESLIEEAVGYAGGTFRDEDGVAHGGTAPDAGAADAQAVPQADAAVTEEASTQDADLETDAEEAAESGSQEEEGDPAVDEPVELTNADGGCSVGTPSPRAASPWWLASLVGALMIGLRRRRG